MTASVRCVISDGREVLLAPGAILGRSSAADLRLNAPHVSEAHALVSLRGTALRLLSLRGRFEVGGQRVDEVQLEEGLVIGLGAGLTLTIEEVRLPETVLALASEEFGVRIPPPVASLYAAGEPMRRGYRRDADAYVWVDDDQLMWRGPEGVEKGLAVGEAIRVGERLWQVEAVPLARAGVERTSGSSRRRERSGLHLVVRYDSVHIWQGAEVACITGVPARIFTELALARVPVEWTTLAGELWPTEDSPRRLRMNWDAGLRRLRRHLRAAGLSPDLVRTDGSGLTELVLQPEDKVEDET